MFGERSYVRHAQGLVVTQSLHAWPATAKFGSFFKPAEMGEKQQNVINSFTQDPISLIFAIHSFTIP